MFITIRNFGPIGEFKYDFSKNIIVTYGDNNIGKSYAMQIVYLLLKYLLYVGSPIRMASVMEFRSRTIDVEKHVLKKLETFAANSSMEEDITQFINSIIDMHLKEAFFNNFLNACENNFGNFDEICKGGPRIDIDMPYSCTISLFIATKNIKGCYRKKGTKLKKVTSDRIKSRSTDNNDFIYFCDNEKKTADVITSIIFSEWRQLGYRILSNVQDVYFFPASRSGIYNGMSAFGSIVAELSKNRAALTRKIELPGISEPIADYFIMLSNIRTRENDDFAESYKEIENEIIKGTVHFNKSRNTLIYKPIGLDFEFDMAKVSSMVSELSPIVALLKYVIRITPNSSISKGATIFIEEPEAHLHPENQIKLLDVLAKLAQKGIKLVMSSHSNYVFNKLNNLVLSGTIDHKNYSPIVLERKNGVSSSRFLSIDDLGAIDENFLQVNLDLLNEREKIIADMQTEE